MELYTTVSILAPPPPPPPPPPLTKYSKINDKQRLNCYQNSQHDKPKRQFRKIIKKFL